MVTGADTRLGRLHGLYRRIQADPEYRTHGMGRVFVPGRGSLEAGGIVFVGEAPGREEENRGLPFVGQAGRNLEELFNEAGLPRETVFITNLIKYRPLTATGGNRSPSRAESRRALPYLLDEIGILSPSLVVCLGLSAARPLLENPCLKMSEANGAVFDRHGLKVLVTYHPSPFNYRIPRKREALKEAFRRLREMEPRTLQNGT